MDIERCIRFSRKAILLSVGSSLPIVLMMSFACGSGALVEAQAVHGGALLRRVPTADETAQQWRDKDPNRFLRIEADFDGDALDEVASIWVNETRKTPTLIVIMKSPSENPHILIRLDVELAFDKLAKIGIRLVEPGAYVTACGKGQRECREDEPKTISITRPSISLFEHEGPETIFYWDVDTDSYVGVDMGS